MLKEARPSKFEEIIAAIKIPYPLIEFHVNDDYDRLILSFYINPNRDLTILLEQKPEELYYTSMLSASFTWMILIPHEKILNKIGVE